MSCDFRLILIYCPIFYLIFADIHYNSKNSTTTATTKIYDTYSNQVCIGPPAGGSGGTDSGSRFSPQQGADGDVDVAVHDLVGFSFEELSQQYENSKKVGFLFNIAASLRSTVDIRDTAAGASLVTIQI